MLLLAVAVWTAAGCGQPPAEPTPDAGAESPTPALSSAVMATATPVPSPPGAASPAATQSSTGVPTPLRHVPPRPPPPLLRRPHLCLQPRLPRHPPASPSHPRLPRLQRPRLPNRRRSPRPASRRSAAARFIHTRSDSTVRRSAGAHSAATLRSRSGLSGSARRSPRKASVSLRSAVAYSTHAASAKMGLPFVGESTSANDPSPSVKPDPVRRLLRPMRSSFRSAAATITRADRADGTVRCWRTQSNASLPQD